MTEIKMNEAALNAAWDAWWDGADIDDAIRAYLSADPDRAARDAVVEAARAIAAWHAHPVLIDIKTTPVTPNVIRDIKALCAAVAALPKETPHD